MSQLTMLTPQRLESAADGMLGLDGNAVLAAFGQQLHPDTRLALLACHAMYSEMVGFDTPVKLMGWFAVWTSRYGLRQEDAQAILRATTDPNVVQHYPTVTKLKTGLAEQVAKVVARRDREAAEAKRKADEAAFREKVRADSGKVREVIADAAERWTA